MHSKEIIITHTTIFDDGECYIRSIVTVSSIDHLNSHLLK